MDFIWHLPAAADDASRGGRGDIVWLVHASRIESRRPLIHSESPGLVLPQVVAIEEKKES